FEQPREQVYTEWGYPAAAPYPEGEILYSHTAPYAGSDRFYPAAEAPIRIQSDFTEGSSGGPWTVGPTSAPTALSVTDYFYLENLAPDHISGAYFGAAVRHLYEAAAGVVVPPVVVPPSPAPPVATEPTPEPTPTPAATPPPATPAPSPATGSLRILGRH